MRDPFSWSLPLGRLFGITVRMHVMFPLVALGLILRATFNDNPDTKTGIWVDATMMMALLFLSVLLHEFGHCFGARLVEGDAHEILMWPLGGLAAIEVPHTPRANFIATAAGPAVNLLICLIAGMFLFWSGYWPPLDPWWWAPYDVTDPGKIMLSNWEKPVLVNGAGLILLARIFWINWVLFLFNVVLIGFPLDGGRLFQCILWPYYGFRQATLYAVSAGFVVMLAIGVFAIFQKEPLILILAWFIYATCRNQWILLETGGEESLFGYDFTQGYTSLEREQAPPRRRRPNFWQRWLQRRAARKLQREQETREAEERRMDELLEKVQREGLQALTDEERRFLKRVSDRYRNRQ